MKRKLIMGMGLVLLAGALSACGGEKSSPIAAVETQEAVQTKAPSETKEQDIPEEDAVTDKTEEEYPEDLNFLYTELDFGYSIRLLNSYHTNAGYGYISLEPVDGVIQSAFSEVIYVTQYSGEVGDDAQKERIDMSQYHDSTDIFNLLRPNLEEELLPGENIMECSVEEKGTKELNGIEMTKFEGRIKTQDKVVESVEHEYLFVAYGIAGKKTPVLVCCVDRTEDLSRHAYWVEKIEDVVSTYRDAE